MVPKSGKNGHVAEVLVHECRDRLDDGHLVAFSLIPHVVRWNVPSPNDVIDVLVMSCDELQHGLICPHRDVTVASVVAPEAGLEVDGEVGTWRLATAERLATLGIGTDGVAGVDVGV